MSKRNRRLLTAAAIAATGYVSALVVGAGAAFAVMLATGVLGEIWFWSELIRRWWGGPPEPVSGTRA